MKKDVDDLLKELKCFVDTRTSAGYGKKGIPDRTGCYRSIYFAIECKPLDTDEPKKWQARRMTEMRAAGGRTICVGAPTHVEQVRAFFAQIDRDLVRD